MKKLILNLDFLLSLVFSFIFLAFALFGCATPKDDVVHVNDGGRDTKPADASHDGAGNDADADADADMDADADADAGDGGPKSGCGNGRIGPYDETVTIDYYSVMRTYRLIVPATYDDEKPAPLIATFHDYGETVDQHIDRSGLKDLSDKEGVIILAALALDDPDAGVPSWNTSQPGSPQADDILLVRDLILELYSRWCIDMDRLYLTGFGRGAFMASRTMFWLSEMFAASQIESGGVISACRPPVKRRPVILFHGDQDTVDPISGGESARNYWRVHDEISSQHTTDSNGCEIYDTPNPDAGVWADAGPQDLEIRFCPVQGMGHARAGVPDSPEDGTMALYKATDLGWQFLKRFKR